LLLKQKHLAYGKAEDNFATEVTQLF
jgi:hypothetical protein